MNAVAKNLTLLKLPVHGLYKLQLL